MNWNLLFTYNTLHDLFFCLIAFVVHECAHVWLAKRRGVFLKVTAWKLFNIIPIGALTFSDINKTTVQDQIDVASIGIWAGLPFTLLMFRPFTFFTAYMLASILDILSITLLSICILLGIPKNMTIGEAGRKYTLDINWRGIKLKRKINVIS